MQARVKLTTDKMEHDLIEMVGRENVEAVRVERERQ